MGWSHMASHSLTRSKCTRNSSRYFGRILIARGAIQFLCSEP
jgi:hypothetical protein